MKIKNICIVGGGSSGWMTAAGILKLLPQMNVTLIESKNVPTVGVGESTNTYINTFLDLLGLEDKDWMSYCNATYKVSIKFTDFAGKGQVYHYPFGPMDMSDGGNIAVWYLWKLFDKDLDNYTFAEYYHPVITMADQNKITNNPFHQVRAFDFKYGTAYHMDATKFGQYLKEKICLPNGLNYIADDVVKVNQNEDGSIKSLSTEDNGFLEADLFVDCTGFKSLLLDKTLKVPFNKFNDSLLNDRAVTAQIPYIDPDKEMECVTNCTAIESGWVWNTPVFNRIGTGYVYSSKFETPESAEKQFRDHLAIRGKKRAEDAKYNHLEMRHGIHETSWKHNVVAIGLAGGFIEPLESSGLLFVSESMQNLVRTLSRKDGNVNKIDKDLWNFSLREKMENMREFISQHYALSSRHDTPYWKHVTEEVSYNLPVGFNDVSPSTTMNAELAKRLHNKIFLAGPPTFEFDPSMGGLLYIATGNGYTPLSSIEIQKYSNFPWQDYKAKWNIYKQELQNCLDQLPTHYEFLKENIINNSIGRRNGR